MVDRRPLSGDSPWSRAIHPGVSACDAYPRCPFEGTRKEVRKHQRECLKSDVGGLYRALKGGYGT